MSDWQQFMHAIRTGTSVFFGYALGSAATLVIVWVGEGIARRRADNARLQRRADRD